MGVHGYLNHRRLGGEPEDIGETENVFLTGHGVPWGRGRGPGKVYQYFWTK